MLRAAVVTSAGSGMQTEAKSMKTARKKMRKGGSRYEARGTSVEM